MQITKVIKFYKNGCIPCKSMDMVLSNIRGLEIEAINIEDHPELVTQYSISTVPTLVYEDRKLVGIHSIREVENWLWQ